MVVGITEASFVYQWETQVEINSTKMGILQPKPQRNNALYKRCHQGIPNVFGNFLKDLPF